VISRARSTRRADRIAEPPLHISVVLHLDARSRLRHIASYDDGWLRSTSAAGVRWNRMSNRPDAISALFRRALQPHPDPAQLERRHVEKLVSRAIEPQELRQIRHSLRALFAQLVVELVHQSSDEWPRLILSRQQLERRRQ